MSVPSLSRDKSKSAEERALFDSLRASGLTAHERRVLDLGVSHLEYHDLGTAKILGGIGKGFAKAMADLMRPRKAKS